MMETFKILIKIGIISQAVHISHDCMFSNDLLLILIKS